MTARTFQVYEHHCLPIGDGGLPVSCMEALHDLAAKTKPFFTEEGGARGRRAIRFCELVGAVRLPDGTTIEILPKVSGVDVEDRTDLTHMLMHTGLFPKVVGNLMTYTAGGCIIDAYLAIVADIAWRLVHQGLSQSYVDQEIRSPFIRGRWLIARQMVRSPMRVDRHELSVSELTPNTSLNRTLKCGLRLMARLTNDRDVGARLRGTVQMMDSVADVHPSEAIAGEVRFNRLNGHWEQLYILVRQFLEQATPFLADGTDTMGMAWLFDMNELFEAYVAARLRKLVRPLPVQTQGPSRALTTNIASGKPTFYQCPDLVIGHPKAPRMIADTKWKRLGADWTKAIDPSDVRQVYAYGRLYGATQVALLYPASGAEPRTTVFTAADAGPELAITVAELPMHRTAMNDLDAILKGLVMVPTTEEVLAS